MSLFVFLLLASSGKYFTQATVYDPQINGLREGMYVLVSKDGTVRKVSSVPIPVNEEIPTFSGQVLLPHFSDFYNLIQERGLGIDEDVNMANQARMARYLCRIGIHKVRDPIFPPIGLSPLMVEALNVYAGRGYLDLAGGPGESFCNLLDAAKGVDYALEQVPAGGPVTFWWTGHGTDLTVSWLKNEAYLKEIITAFKERGQSVGAYIQDAGVREMEALKSFPFDFYEGLPAVTVDVNTWPKDVVWVPLAALNDKRYCAVDLGKRLERLYGLGLYEEADRAQAVKAESSVRSRISARCKVWRERRETTFEPLRQWIEAGGAIALGSAGGHSFSFSGDLSTELSTLEELGATQPALLEAAFVHTPKLLGDPLPYLTEGKPANFLVYESGGYWGSLVGTRVRWNYLNGKEITRATPLPL